MSLIGKQVIHKNFQSESFYFFWFPGAPIVGILVSYLLEKFWTDWESEFGRRYLDLCKGGYQSMTLDMARVFLALVNLLNLTS